MFPDNHLAKYANIPALFEEAQKRQLGSDKFQDFIINELSRNAQLWVSMKELNQIRKKNQVSKKTQSPGGAGAYNQRVHLGSKVEEEILNPQKNETKKHKGSRKRKMGVAPGVKIETIMEEDDNSFSVESN